MTSEGRAADNLFWVHCNRCTVPMFSGKSSPPTKMMFSSCGCIFCTKCSTKSTENGCKSCGAKKKVQLLPIGKNLPQRVMEMFNNNETSMSKLEKRINFQKVHCVRNEKQLDRFTAYQASRTRKNQEAERKQLLMGINDLERRTKTKKEKLAKLESALIRFKAKSKKIILQTKVKRSIEKNKKPSTSDYLVAGGLISPLIHKSSNSSFMFGQLFWLNLFQCPKT